jgi:hypothetical protein
MEVRTGVIKPIDCVKEGWELIKPITDTVCRHTRRRHYRSDDPVHFARRHGQRNHYVYLKRIDGGPVVFDDLWRLFLVVPRSWSLPSFLFQ